MERSRRLLAWSAAAALVAGLTACASDEGEAETGSTTPTSSGFVDVVEAAGDPVDGGTLTFADYSEARSLDPIDTIATGASGGAALAAVYDVLVRYDDATAEYEPWLAESIDSNETATEWTLKLRDGVTFSDGTEMVAADVVASIDRYIEGGGSDAAVLAKNIVDMSAPDESTVVFTLDHAWSTFPRMLALGAGMVVAPSATEGKQFRPIGAGPFELDTYAPSEELVLTARADYWAGAPHLDALRFVWLNGGSAALDSLRAGDADVAFLREPDVVRDARADKLPGYLTLLGLGNTLWINHREGRPGEDVRVRRAIALAMDAEIDMERTYRGAGMPTKNIFGPESRWWSGEEQVPVDKEEASRLLEAARADGYDGKLTLVGGTTPTSRTESVTIKALLEDVGFEVETDLLNNIADRIQRMYVDRDFDIAVGSGSVSEADPFHQLNDNLASDSYLNVMGYQSERMDEQLTALQGAQTDAEKQQVIDVLQQIWTDEAPAVNLATFAHLLAWDREVHGIQPNAEYMMLFSQAWQE